MLFMDVRWLRLAINNYLYTFPNFSDMLGKRYRSAQAI